jgi:capsular polysaccharide biosynthesis protein
MSRRGPAVPLIGAAVGLLLGVAVTLLQDSTYRADASIVLVRQGQPPGSDARLTEAAAAAAELFDSRAVAESAIRNLGLDDTPQDLVDRLDVDSGESSSLVRIEVEAPSKEEARRTAQEAAEVATVLFNDRFAPQTTASVWEPAAADEERVSPKPARNLALGLLLGTLVGLAIVLLGLFRGERSSRPAGGPTAVPPVPEAAADAGREPATSRFRVPGSGEWTVADLERLLAEQGDAFPERREELELYLDSFRGVADPDGRLSGDLELVIEDVFGPLIARAR